MPVVSCQSAVVGCQFSVVSRHQRQTSSRFVITDFSPRRICCSLTGITPNWLLATLQLTTALPITDNWQLTTGYWQPLDSPYFRPCNPLKTIIIDKIFPPKGSPHWTYRQKVLSKGLTCVENEVNARLDDGLASCANSEALHDVGVLCEHKAIRHKEA